MSEVLNPAAEFDYSPRVRELFANLKHAGSIPVSDPVGAVREPPIFSSQTPEGGSRAAPTKVHTVLNATVGSRKQGASVQLYIEVRDARAVVVRYQAYGCPHFLAACESLAQWLEGRAVIELPQWRWRDVEAELAVPASKRSRLLLLDEAVSALSNLASRLG